MTQNLEDVLIERLDAQSERIDAMSERMDAMSGRIAALSGLVEELSGKAGRLWVRADAFHESIQTIDTRLSVAVRSVFMATRKADAALERVAAVARALQHVSFSDDLATLLISWEANPEVLPGEDDA